MPNKPKPEKYHPLELLSRRDQTDYDTFVDSLLYLHSDLPYLSLIGIDTPRLGEAILADLSRRLPELYVETTELNPTRDLLRLFRSYQRGARPVVLPLFRQENLDYEEAAAQLLFHRDFVARANLSLIVLCDRPLYETLQWRAYDFLAFCNFTYSLTDQLAPVERDLTPPDFVPWDLEDYEKTLEELRIYEAGNALPHLLMKKYYNTGIKALAISRLDQALDFFRKSYELADRLNDDAYRSQALDRIGSVFSNRGEHDLALSYYEQALEIDRRVQDLQGIGSNLSLIGLTYHLQGKNEEALHYLQEALNIHSQIGYQIGMGSHLGHIGLIHFEKGDYDQALSFHRQALELHRGAGFLRGQAVHLGNIGLVYKEKGQYDEALVCHKKALEIDQRIGYPQGEGEDFFNIGEIYQHLQAYEEARRYFRKALEIFQHLDLQAPMEKVVEHLTEIENLT